MLPTTRKTARAAGEPLYFTGKACRAGHQSARYTSSGMCIGCAKAWAESPKGRAADRRWKDDNPKRRWAGISVANARGRAEAAGVPFDISAEFIASIAPDVCPVFGMPLIYVGGKGWHEGSPTIDRRDPAKGYVAGNVAVISAKANRIKSDATVEEIWRVADWLANG